MTARQNFRAYDLIAKKRDGKELTSAEIHWLIGEFTAERLPAYQMSAFLMAVYFQGMSDSETTALTEAMVDSGEILDLSSVPGIKVDKHSTGGVGDKTTLILVPTVAACGLPVAKMSGRGLGHTGGTIDKLESIPGVRTDLSMDSFLRQLESVGAVVAGQTGNLTPADKSLYALRDVTATVESIPLIAASIMAKKIAAGADAFVLDIKVGRAAFMKTEVKARELAMAMIGIARGFGRRAVAWMTDMDEPLGSCVGNSIEVYEAVDTLQGQGPDDLVELTLTLGTEMLLAGGVADDAKTAREKLEKVLASGEAYAKFEEIILAQGADLKAFSDMRRQFVPPNYSKIHVNAPADGFIGGINGLEVGLVAMSLGAGRTRTDQTIDPHVGVRLLKKSGDQVCKNEPLAEIIVSNALDQHGVDAVIRRSQNCFEISTDPPSIHRPLLGDRFET